MSVEASLCKSDSPHGHAHSLNFSLQAGHVQDHPLVEGSQTLPHSVIQTTDDLESNVPGKTTTKKTK